MSNRIMRDSKYSIIGGVCSGLGKYFGIEPLLIRILWVVAIFGYGVGLLLYLILWLVLPEE